MGGAQERACGVHAACMWRACGVHAVRMHAVGRRTGELGGEEVLRRCAQVELVDVVLREDGPLGATVEPGVAARGLELLRELAAARQQQEVLCASLGGLCCLHGEIRQRCGSLGLGCWSDL